MGLACSALLLVHRAQATLMVTTMVLIIASAILETALPRPVGSILIVTTAVLTFGSAISVAAYLSEVRHGRDVVG